MSLLQTILQELVNHVVAETGKEADLTVILPQNLANKVTMEFTPKESVIMPSPQEVYPSDSRLVLHLTGGKVRLKGDLDGMTLNDLEKRYIVRALEKHGGNKTRAAAELGVTIKTVYNKLHQYGLFEQYSNKNT